MEEGKKKKTKKKAASSDDVGSLFKGNMHRLHLLALEISQGHYETLKDVQMRQHAEKKSTEKLQFSFQQTQMRRGKLVRENRRVKRELAFSSFSSATD